MLFQSAEKDWTEKTGEDLCAEMDKLLEENEFVTQKYHQQWFYNIAMRLGAQWLQANPQGFTILPENESGHVRMIVNKILGAHQRKLAKILKNNPWFEIEADKTSYKSKKKARKGTKLADYVYYGQKMKKKLKTLSTWMLDVGTAFLFIYWDWDKGDLLTDYQPIPDDGILPEGTIAGDDGYLRDVNGELIPAAQSKEGDVVVEFVSAFDVYPYGIKSDGTAFGLIYDSEQDVDDMKIKYPDFADKITAGTGKKNRVDYYRRIMGIISDETYYTSESKKKSNTCIVQQLFESASVKHPKGRHIIRVGDNIVHRGDLPYRHGRIPIIKFIDIENSGQYWGMGMVQNAIPVQKGFNRSFSQLIENGNNHANIKWKVTKGAEITEETLDDTCTEIIRYKKGEQVDQVEPPQMPGYFINLVQNLYPQAFNDVTGQHEVTQGKVLPGVKSGRGIEALQQQDDTQNAPTQIDISASVEEVGEQIMALYEEHVRDDRIFNIRGTGKRIEIGPADLDGLWKNVHVRSTSMLSHDMYMKKEELKDLWSDGLFGPPQDPKVRKKVMQLYEFGDIESMFEDEDLDTEWAQEENDLLLGDDTSKFQKIPMGDSQIVGPNGLPMPPPMVLTLPIADYEDQLIHIQEHNNLRKSVEFRDAPQIIKDRINWHIKLHEQMMQKLAPPAPMPEVEGPKKLNAANGAGLLAA